MLEEKKKKKEQAKNQTKDNFGQPFYCVYEHSKDSVDPVERIANNFCLISWINNCYSIITEDTKVFKKTEDRQYYQTQPQNIKFYKEEAKKQPQVKANKQKQIEAKKYIEIDYTNDLSDKNIKIFEKNGNVYSEIQFEDLPKFFLKQDDKYVEISLQDCHSKKQDKIFEDIYIFKKKSYERIDIKMNPNKIQSEKFVKGICQSHELKKESQMKQRQNDKKNLNLRYKLVDRAFEDKKKGQLDESINNYKISSIEKAPPEKDEFLLQNLIQTDQAKQLDQFLKRRKDQSIYNNWNQFHSNLNQLLQKYNKYPSILNVTSFYQDKEAYQDLKAQLKENPPPRCFIMKIKTSESNKPKLYTIDYIAAKLVNIQKKYMFYPLKVIIKEEVIIKEDDDKDSKEKHQKVIIKEDDDKDSNEKHKKDLFYIKPALYRFDDKQTTGQTITNVKLQVKDCDNFFETFRFKTDENGDQKNKYWKTFSVKLHLYSKLEPSSLEYPIREPSRIRNKPFPDQKHYSLAFQGGGAKGVSYVGAYKALMERKSLSNKPHPIRSIIGSSAGGIIALGVSTGLHYQEIQEICYLMDEIPKKYKIQSTPENGLKVSDIINKIKKILSQYGILDERIISYVADKFKNQKFSYDLQVKLVKLLKAISPSFGEIFSLEDGENKLNLIGLLENGALMSGDAIYDIAGKCLINYFLQSSIFEKSPAIILSNFREHLQNIKYDKRYAEILITLLKKSKGLGSQIGKNEKQFCKILVQILYQNPQFTQEREQIKKIIQKQTKYCFPLIERVSWEYKLAVANDYDFMRKIMDSFNVSLAFYEQNNRLSEHSKQKQPLQAFFSNKKARSFLESIGNYETSINKLINCKISCIQESSISLVLTTIVNKCFILINQYFLMQREFYKPEHFLERQNQFSEGLHFDKVNFNYLKKYIEFDQKIRKQFIKLKRFSDYERQKNKKFFIPYKTNSNKIIKQSKKQITFLDFIKNVFFQIPNLFQFQGNPQLYKKHQYLALKLAGIIESTISDIATAQNIKEIEQQTKIRQKQLELLKEVQALTLAQYYRINPIEITCTSVDLDSKILRLLNHKTAPLLPVCRTVQMSGSFPVGFKSLTWQKQWGKYYVYLKIRRIQIDLTGHEFTDGGMLANFPIKYFDNDSMSGKYFSHFSSETAANNILVGFGLDDQSKSDNYLKRDEQEKSELDKTFKINIAKQELYSFLKAEFLYFKTIPQLKLIYFMVKKWWSVEENWNALNHKLLDDVPLIKFVRKLLNAYPNADKNLNIECFREQVVFKSLDINGQNRKINKSQIIRNQFYLLASSKTDLENLAQFETGNDQRLTQQQLQQSNANVRYILQSYLQSSQTKNGFFTLKNLNPDVKVKPRFIKQNIPKEQPEDQPKQEQKQEQEKEQEKEQKQKKKIKKQKHREDYFKTKTNDLQMQLKIKYLNLIQLVQKLYWTETQNIEQALIYQKLMSNIQLQSNLQNETNAVKLAKTRFQHQYRKRNFQEVQKSLNFEKVTNNIGKYVQKKKEQIQYVDKMQLKELYQNFNKFDDEVISRQFLSINPETYVSADIQLIAERIFLYIKKLNLRVALKQLQKLDMTSVLEQLEIDNILDYLKSTISKLSPDQQELIRELIECVNIHIDCHSIFKHSARRDMDLIFKQCSSLQFMKQSLSSEKLKSKFFIQLEKNMKISPKRFAAFILKQIPQLKSLLMEKSDLGHQRYVLHVVAVLIKYTSNQLAQKMYSSQEDPQKIGKFKKRHQIIRNGIIDLIYLKGYDQKWTLQSIQLLKSKNPELKLKDDDFIVVLMRSFCQKHQQLTQIQLQLTVDVLEIKEGLNKQVKTLLLQTRIQILAEYQYDLQVRLVKQNLAKRNSTLQKIIESQSGENLPQESKQKREARITEAKQIQIGNQKIEKKFDQYVEEIKRLVTILKQILSNFQFEEKDVKEKIQNDQVFEYQEYSDRLQQNLKEIIASIYDTLISNLTDFNLIPIGNIGNFKIERCFIIKFQDISRLVEEVYYLHKNMTQEKKKKKENDKDKDKQKQITETVMTRAQLNVAQIFQKILKSRYTLPQFFSNLHLCIENKYLDDQVNIKRIIKSQITSWDAKKSEREKKQRFIQEQKQRFIQEQKQKYLQELKKQKDLQEKKKQQGLQEKKKQQGLQEKKKQKDLQEKKNQRSFEEIKQIKQINKQQSLLKPISSILKVGGNQKIQNHGNSQSRKTKRYVHLVLEGIQNSYELYYGYYRWLSKILKQSNNNNPKNPEYFIGAITSSNFHSIFSFLLATNADPEELRTEMQRVTYLANTIEDSKKTEAYFDSYQWIRSSTEDAREFYDYLWEEKIDFFGDIEGKVKQCTEEGLEYSYRMENIKVLFQKQKNRFVTYCDDIIHEAIQQSSNITKNSNIQEHSVRFSRKFALDLVCDQNNTHQYKATNKAAFKNFQFIMKKIFQSFGSLIDCVITTMIKENSGQDLKPELLGQSSIWKAVLIKRLLTTYKLKRYILDRLVKEKFRKGITLKEFFQQSKKKILLTFTTIDLDSKRIQFMNKNTFPNLPLWTAIIAASTRIMLHRPFEIGTDWSSKTTSTNYSKLMFNDFFNYNENHNETSKDKISYVSANFVSSLPLQFLTNQTLKSKIFTYDDEGQVKQFAQFALAFEGVSTNPQFQDKPFEKKYLKINFSDIWNLVNLFFPKKTSCWQDKHENTLYKSSAGFGEVSKKLFGLIGQNQSGSLLSILTSSNDNFVLAWYEDKVVKLPIKLGTLEFHLIIDKDKKKQFKINLPSRETTETIQKSYEITKYFISGNAEKETPEEYKVVIRMSYFEKEICKVKKSYCKLEFLSHTQWNRKRQNRFSIFYRAESLMKGKKAENENEDLDGRQSADNSEAVLALNQSSSIRLWFYYAIYDEKYNSSHDKNNPSKNCIQYTTFVFHLSRLIQEKKFTENLFHYKDTTGALIKPLTPIRINSVQITQNPKIKDSSSEVFVEYKQSKLASEEQSQFIRSKLLDGKMI